MNQNLVSLRIQISDHNKGYDSMQLPKWIVSTSSSKAKGTNSYWNTVSSQVSTSTSFFTEITENLWLYLRITEILSIQMSIDTDMLMTIWTIPKPQTQKPSSQCVHQHSSERNSCSAFPRNIFPSDIKLP